MNDGNVSATARSPVGIRPFGGLLGAEVTGVDAATDTSGVMPTIWEAFTRHRLVVLRNQQLTDQQIYEFAQRFGPVEKNKNRDATGTVFGDVHSITNLDADGNPSRRPGVNENYYWHSDKAHEAVPCLLTMLYAVEIPPTGGDTEFAAMEAAYDALDPETKARIENLYVEHSWGYMRETITGRPPTDEEKLKSPPVVHPLVRVHPDTGRKSLYLGMYCRRIIDSPDEDEGRTLLKQLTEHATQPRFIFTHKWQPRDLIFWDNRCLMHRAIANFNLSAHRRVLRRAVVKGKPEWIARQP